MALRLTQTASKALTKVFGSRNERILKSIYPIVDRVNHLERDFARLSDADLARKTVEFRDRLAGKETLDDLLPEAFAAVREASRRTLGLRHFDVQLIGGIVLHRGSIAEMVTGEGKTLVATLSSYLNALPGLGVHVVTVNDYLARRDRDWMGPIFEALGMTVGAIQSDMDNAGRKVEYGCDITYGTNNEFGFDYLRDNMKFSFADQVQKRQHYAIIDEVDSILIDEARTPLIISGPAEKSTEKYYQANRIAKKLEKGVDFEVKEKEKIVVLTEEGIEKAEQLAGVDSFYTGVNMDWPHHIEQALRAHNLYRRDVDYVVKAGEIIIVDEFTGRLMHGRRWSDGLHQAVEAKENLRIKDENQTLATITFQNFFRLYDKLAGMTGTAMTEAAEFDKIYGLDVVSVPTNRPLIRKSYNDVVYRTKREKWDAIVEEIFRAHGEGRPILVGTISIENSELLSGMLSRRGIEHEVLNAKHHEREAQIIAKAGQEGNVTIATNMAGRGTDIVLGEGVVDRGGLHIVGTERHESRRIDNQLRGRSGRQGDPGSSRFFLSLEDDLMRVFASERVSAILGKLGMQDGQDIQSPMVNRAIERAQKKVEGHNFEIRKNLLEYDKVMDEHRKIVYEQRTRVLQGEGMREMIEEMIADSVAGAMDEHFGQGKGDWDGFLGFLGRKFGIRPSRAELENLGDEELLEHVGERIREAYDERERMNGPDVMRRIEGFLLLNAFDTKWKDHLLSMDHLRSGIQLRAYGQLDPKVEYKKEAYRLFDEMIESIRNEVTDYIFRLRVQKEEERKLRDTWSIASTEHEAAGSFDESRRQSQRAVEADQSDQKPKPIHRVAPKVGRNDPCPCGSGKKYKKCCGSTDGAR
jgi:preprotein translocase subunit SecA